ncbi:phosphatidate cytidylyltransferase, partial [Rhodopseudomonas palustris]
MNQDNAAPAPAAEQGSRNLLMRVGTALVLAPGSVALAYIGGWPWAILVTLVAIGLYVEWLTVVGAGKNWPLIGTGSLALAGGGIGLALARLDASLAAIAIGLVAVGLSTPAPRRWAVTGFCYAAAALFASILLRNDPDHGFVALMLILLVVWVTDIGGYFAGRGIGGPKLWPRVSPKKTWAGAIGGFVASLAIGAGFAAFGFGKFAPLLILAAVLSTVSQLGDLFESAVKRQFGVKDSSHIIPGHGGLLDRLDGYVAAA